MAHADQHSDSMPRAQTRRRLLWSLYGLCALLVALEFVVHRHAKHPWEDLFAFYPLFTLIGGMVLVIVAGQLRKLLKREEAYYDDRDR